MQGLHHIILHNRTKLDLEANELSFFNTKYSFLNDSILELIKNKKSLDEDTSVKLYVLQISEKFSTLVLSYIVHAKLVPNLKKGTKKEITTNLDEFLECFGKNKLYYT